jgi:hypothetical protein
MKTRQFSLVVLSGFLILCMMPPLFAGSGDEKAKTEVYSARVVPAGAPAPPLSIKIYISGTTTDEEVHALAAALKNGGSDALEKAMDKMDNGRVTPPRSTGTKVAVIRTKKTETGQSIILVTDRPITFAELWRGSRSQDYPFGIIQLNLDEKGNGDGSMIVAAKIKINDDNTIEVESYGMGPSKLIGVSHLD